jgi:hypothetical protein
VVLGRNCASPTAELKAGGGRTWPGKGGGVVLAHLGFDFGAWTGRRKCRRWGRAEPWISGRERHCSDVDAHRGGHLVAWGAPVGACGGGGWLTDWWQ